MVYKALSDKHWSSQDCAASTINFNVAFQLVLKFHSARVGKIGYQIASTSIVVSKPTFADDVALVDSTARGCQDSVAVWRGFGMDSDVSFKALNTAH